MSMNSAEDIQEYYSNYAADPMHCIRYGFAAQILVRQRFEVLHIENPPHRQRVDLNEVGSSKQPSISRTIHLEISLIRC